MRKLLEVLRLHYESNLSQRKIARATNVSRPTVQSWGGENFAKLTSLMNNFWC